MNKDIKIGVIGTGNMGRNHARIYSELKGVEDIYVFDLNKNITNSMEKSGFIVCDSMEELLEYVDAVSICVPTKYHFDVAKAVIEKGIHCLIEKPITSTVKEGKELLDIVQNRKSGDKNLIIGVGHIERFNPIVNEIAKMIENPSFVDIRRHNPSSLRIKDSSVIEDLMVHDIDIVFNILFNNKNYKICGAGDMDTYNAIITFNGVSVTVSMSASKKGCKKIRKIYIEDEKFTIDGDFMTQEIYTYWKPEKYGVERGKYTQENIIEKIVVNKVEPLKIELDTFMNCIRNNVDFPVTIEQAVNNLRICEKMKGLLT